jgi:hypothetical protein
MMREILSIRGSQTSRRRVKSGIVHSDRLGFPR